MIEKLIVNRFENNVLEYCECYNVNNNEIVFKNKLLDLLLTQLDKIIEMTNQFFIDYNTMVIIDCELEKNLLDKGFKLMNCEEVVEKYGFIKKEGGFLYGFNFNNYDELKSFEKIIKNEKLVLITILEEVVK